MQKILQGIAHSVGSGQQIPLLERAEEYESISIPACNGDGEIFVERQQGTFVLRIGNNDVSDNGGWTEVVKRMGIEVEEAEHSPALAKKYARDCTCGIRFFDGYEGLLEDGKRSPGRQLKHEVKRVLAEIGGEKVG